MTRLYPGPRLRRILAWRTVGRGRGFAATPEAVLLAASVFMVATGNRHFFAALLAGRSFGEPGTWGYLAAVGVALVGLHFLMLALLCVGRALKPVIVAAFLLAAVAAHYIQAYGIVLDPSMLRNVLHSDPAEALELLDASLWLRILLCVVLPGLLLWRIELRPRRLRWALLVRGSAMACAALVAVLALWTVLQPFSSSMRGQKVLRYMITPANVLWSGAQVLVADARGASAPRKPIGEDAAPGPSWSQPRKPVVLVLVVGETARAVNWGLNGYFRQTTPELAQLPVVNFTDVTSCGTSTEVSLPCMFAPVGRRDYDEARIRGSESLLHVVARAGVAVDWRDNQSGCKGVCEGLPSERVADLAPPEMCQAGRCSDAGLLLGLDERLAAARGSQLIVLHQLGNHGPSYFRRYPAEFARFQPVCERDDLRLCSREEIVNAYDNALLYTDHLLAQLIRTLQAHAGQVDTAMIYVSDHGESLGESNLFLHGMPYMIAPAQQTHVPMVMWFSSGFQQTMGLDNGCLRVRASAAVSHDNLFHTVLSLLDIQTHLHEPSLDLAQSCMAAPAQAKGSPQVAHHLQPDARVYAERQRW